MTVTGRMKQATAGAGSDRAKLGLALALSLTGLGALALLYFATVETDGPTGAALQTEQVDLAALPAAQAEVRAFDLVKASLEGVYTAFERTEEGAIYDALAMVSKGEALEQLYLQRRAALMERGLDKVGQQVHELELVAVTARREGEALRADARWRVVGIIGHQAHRHVRGNAYAAELLLDRGPEGWRIAGFDLREIDRTEAGMIVETKPSHRAGSATGTSR